MNQVVLVGVDGSDESLAAARTGLDRLVPGRVVLATVVDAGDPMLVAGASGLAGGALTAEELDELRESNLRAGRQLLDQAVADLGRDVDDAQVLTGSPGPELARYAGEIGATVLLVGSRGRGGLKRALLGSVSDHLVRHAPCPVLVVREDVEDAGGG